MSADQQTRNKKPRKPRSDFRRLGDRFMSSLLRSLFVINKPTRAGQAGFVLPTTVLLLLVMTLTVGALSFRTASRTQSTFLAREQQVIDNIAAPAIDRAKAKLEYLFTNDTRLPGSGTPSSDVLAILMLNQTSTGAEGVGISALTTSPYDLPKETRIDINGDGKLDNAWSFEFDVDGDGNPDPGETIAYSILLDDAVDPLDVDGDPATNPTPERSNDIKLEDIGVAENKKKAKNLVVRNGPVNTDETISNCGGAREPEQGWLAISSSTVEKNFQITTYVSNGKDLGRVNSAFELQQVRRASRGNRWGAWFKYDMEIYPGPEFNWNGAIHSDGNIMLTDDFRGHMISSHNSCLYSRESSQITMAEKNNDKVEGININAGDFQGQLVLGIPSKGYGQADKDGNASPTDIHIFTSDNAAPKIADSDTTLTNSNDSIRKRGSSSSGSKPDGNPEAVAVDPVALFSRGVSQHRDVSKWQRDSAWETNVYKVEGRVLNQFVRSPYLDDFYRADNRYGPSPSYGDDTNWVTSTDDDALPNTTRSSPDYDKSLGEQIISTDRNSGNLLNETSGLDGYWERQAINNGMRIIIGQRLELGDNNGWNFRSPDNAIVPDTDPLYPPTLKDSTANKQRQRVTLRDNLSSVQGMVVYHYESGSDGHYPLACIANTAHPGTWQTLVDSRTFTNYPGDHLKTDFFSGQGTNGWEFSFPSTFDNESDFGTQVAAANPLGKALRNLAYFAGDPKGGAPSFTPVQEANSSDIVHPFPHQAMWGDFSILRRILDEYLDAPSAVAYSDLSIADKSSLHSAACTLGLLAYDMNTVKQEYDAIPNDRFVAIGKQLISWGNPSYNSLTKGQYTALGVDGALIARQRQTERDRKLGFAKGCPDSGIFAGKVASVPALEAALEAAFCSAQQPPKYPSLYYLFPRENHDRDGSGTQPSEEYINKVKAYDTGKNFTTLEAADIAFVPQKETIASSKLSTWTLPTEVSTSTGNLNPESMSIKLPDGKLAKLSLLDKVMYNGREEMAVRVLDIDLGRLTRNQNSSDYWISDGKETASGILYTAREDAVREDAIVRPQAANWTSCKDLTKLLSSTCYMDTSSDSPNDPPLSRRLKDGSFVGISLKPIDFAPDPDRRPYGFRLNAALNRERGDLSGSNPSNVSQRNWGFTFVTDNAAYIKGEFNPHSKTGNNTIEEFTATLLDNAVNYGLDFYDKRKKENINTSIFATDIGDRWRVAEVLADSVSILSEKFVDGSVEEGFIRDQDKKSGDFKNVDGALSKVSFHNQQRPMSQSSTDNASKFRLGHSGKWLRTNGKYPRYDDSSWVENATFQNRYYPVPIWIGRNGESRVKDNNGSTQFYRNVTNAEGNTYEAAPSDNPANNGTEIGGNDFELPDEREQDDLIVVPLALKPRVNATIISGLVPSRAKQSYGGLHNFPRFLEKWKASTETELFMQGAFLQLNFSTASTAPFDIDAWDPGDAPIDDERINYYAAPQRRWGYDVALQYSPAGPIAQRFVTVERPRSEHYRELPIEDPYVANLRCSRKEDGKPVFAEKADPSKFFDKDCSQMLVPERISYISTVSSKNRNMPTKYGFRKQRLSKAGLTLIECLVAIVVIALTTATVTPVMIFSVATRVQNQKTEQALQLAQAEIDKVKLIVEQGGDYGSKLLLPVAPTGTTNLIDVGAPSSAFLASTASATLVSQAKKIDTDGDGDDDFAIQLFRTEGIEAGSASTPVVFDMGVRVYDARANANVGSLQKEEAGLTFTSGGGSRGTRPLAVLYSQIAQGDRVGSLCQYWKKGEGDPVTAGLQCN